MSEAKTEHVETIEPLTGEEFASLTVGQFYDMVEQSGEKLVCMSLNGEDGQPFAMFALAIDSPEVLDKYARALNELKPLPLSEAMTKARLQS